MSMSPEPRPEKPPSGFSADLGRSVRWFTIWLLVGMAPFLGKVKVPGLAALIELYPSSLQGWLIPVSGVLMGMIAVIVEFAGSTPTPKRTVRRWLARTSGIFAISFVLLVCVYTFAVVQVDRPVLRDANSAPDVVSLAVITGSRSVPPQFPGSECKCAARQPAERCIADITLNPANVATCFGSDRIAFAILALVFLYLAVTGSFVAAIGILVIRKRSSAA